MRFSEYLIFKMKNFKLKFKRGFTLVELIVVISIFSILAGVTLFNFSGFNSNVTLQNLANQIALQIKTAQTNAISGKLPSSFLPPSKPSFGVYFDISGGQNRDKFIYFADISNQGYLSNGFNSVCGGASGNECLSQITIQSGDLINKICVNGGTDCGNQILNITFKRPFPDASFYYGNSLNNSISDAEIEIISKKGQMKTIIVRSTGQIEIKNGGI